MLWLYALDHCDHIGIVELDLEYVSLDCSLKCNDKNVAELGDRVQHIGGSRYFIPKFIGFQYGKLSSSCRPHEKVIESIQAHGLTLTHAGYRYPCDDLKGMNRVSDGVPDTPKEQDRIKTGKEEDKNKTRGTRLELEQFCRDSGLYPRDAEYLWNRWEGNGWQNANKPIKDWKATIRAWKAQQYLPSQKQQLASDCWPEPVSEPEPEIDLWEKLEANRAKAAEREAAENAEPDSTGESEWT